MIVADPAELILTTQTDHAAFAAELLSLWRTDGLAENPRRQAILLATREHDNGWAETDSAPRHRGDGRPHDYKSLPAAERLELWRRGVDRWRERDPAVAVYVVRHALALHEQYGHGGEAEPRTEERWRQTLVSWRELEDELREAAGLAAEDLDADYRFLALADVVSLAVCGRWTDETTADGPQPGDRVRFTFDPPRALRLDPFPLAGVTTFRLRSRRIPDRVYESDVDLALELASAPWDTLAVRVVPWAYENESRP